MTAAAKSGESNIGKVPEAQCAALCSERRRAKSDNAANDEGTSNIPTVPVVSQSDAQTTPLPSFYQRKLPETCVAFASPQGKNIFRSALRDGGLKSFYNLIEQHHTQTEPAFCGLSTLVLVLNALAVDPGQHWKGPWRWYEEKMLNCCVGLEEIKQTGISLPDFQCLALCQGLTVDLRYCDETSSLQDFRETVERACLEDRDPLDRLECLVVSYSRKVLQQTGDGHFSPLAAYDRESDSVLILDTARFKYGAHWTKLPLLYEAMKPVDKSTGKSRGYALLSFISEEHPEPEATAVVVNSATTDNTTTSTTPAEPPPPAIVIPSPSKLSTQPASILYRSMMNQSRKRRQYKDYTDSLREQSTAYKSGEEDIPYELVRNYWYEGGESPSSVWEIIVPARVRTEEFAKKRKEEKELLRKIRSFLTDLHYHTMAAGGGKDATAAGDGDNDDDDVKTRKPICETYHPSANQHTVSVSAEETVYIIYLATLSKDRRYDLVMNFDSDSSADLVVRNQIIQEADMIASAIDVSDKLTSL